MRKTSLVVLVFWFGCLAGGCGMKSASRAYVSGKVLVSNADGQLLDIALSDMIDNKQFDPAVGGRRVTKSQVVLDNTTFGGLSGHLLSHVSSDSAKPIPLGPRVDLLQRNPKGRRYTLEGYHPSNPNVLVADLGKVDLEMGFDAVFSDARGYVQPYLPGYSEDGQSAVFLFRFGPTSHGAIGYYLLSKASGHWEIVTSYFGYSL